MALAKFGIPRGYEVSTIVADEVQVAGGMPDLSSKWVRQLSTLDAAVVMPVALTPTCPCCPQAAYLAHQMGMAPPWVTAETFEAPRVPPRPGAAASSPRHAQDSRQRLPDGGGRRARDAPSQDACQGEWSVRLGDNWG